MVAARPSARLIGRCRNSASLTWSPTVCSGDSERQLEAIWDAILEALEERGVRPLHKEGARGSGWLLADYGSVVIHIFAKAEREFYQLEALWKDAVPVLRIQ